MYPINDFLLLVSLILETSRNVFPDRLIVVKMGPYSIPWITYLNCCFYPINFSIIIFKGRHIIFPIHYEIRKQNAFFNRQYYILFMCNAKMSPSSAQTYIYINLRWLGRAKSEIQIENYCILAHLNHLVERTPGRAWPCRGLSRCSKYYAVSDHARSPRCKCRRRVLHYTYFGIHYATYTVWQRRLWVSTIAAVSLAVRACMSGARSTTSDRKPGCRRASWHTCAQRALSPWTRRE